MSEQVVKSVNATNKMIKDIEGAKSPRPTGGLLGSKVKPKEAEMTSLGNMASYVQQIRKMRKANA
jgi:hypothetical protein